MVQRIKAVPNETKLLVIDDKADQYYKAKNIVVTSSMSNVVYKQTPVPRPNSTTVVLTPIDNETVNNGSIHSEEDRPSRMSHMSDSYNSGSGSSSPVRSLITWRITYIIETSHCSFSPNVDYHHLNWVSLNTCSQAYGTSGEREVYMKRERELSDGNRAKLYLYQWESVLLRSIIITITFTPFPYAIF